MIQKTQRLLLAVLLALSVLFIPSIVSHQAFASGSMTLQGPVGPQPHTWYEFYFFYSGMPATCYDVWAQNQYGSQYEWARYCPGNTSGAYTINHQLTTSGVRWWIWVNAEVSPPHQSNFITWVTN